VVSRPRLRNHPVEQPYSPDEGYHFSVDITDRPLEFIRDAKAIAPDKPFFLYYCPGACHAPHHAPREWIDRYKGRFDMGYEAYRELVFERQKQMGVVTDRAELSAINPYIDERGPEGQAWPELDTVRPWDSLSGDEKRLFCRMAEVYAGFLGHIDNEIGRLLDHLEESGELDDTLIVLVSDNGASGEGGPNGSVNENKIFKRTSRQGRGEPAVPRRPRQPADVQPLSDRMGLGVQHAVQDVEALFQLRGWHRGSDDRRLAERPRSDRRLPPARACDRHRDDRLRVPRDRAP
jgi:arylsulfatase A-like enzyme